MKTLVDIKFKNSLRFALLFIAFISLIFIYGCDTFEEDALPPGEVVDISANQVFVLPNSSSVIDLAQVVSARENVSVSITDGPDRGQFQNIEGNLFKYSPNADFLNGTDQVGFDILSITNEYISEGVINITVTQDTSLFPCAIIAVQDRVSTGQNMAVALDILANDRLCGIDSLDLAVSIIREPANGEAVLLDQRQLRYSPNANFVGLDSLLYKVNPISEPDSGSVALVYINVLPPDLCIFDARDDQFNFRIPGSEAITLNVLSNDVLCDADSTQIGFVTILQSTVFGDVAVVENNQVRYWPAVNRLPYTDSLTYRICNNDTCDVANVVLNLEPPVACTTNAFDDFYTLSDTTQQTTYWFNVLENDQYCSLSAVDIAIVEGALSGETGVSDKMVIYAPFNNTPSDSLTYRICEMVDGIQRCDEAKVRISK